jgi:hypothetical protein
MLAPALTCSCNVVRLAGKQGTENLSAFNLPPWATALDDQVPISTEQTQLRIVRIPVHAYWTDASPTASVRSGGLDKEE